MIGTRTEMAQIDFDTIEVGAIIGIPKRKGYTFVVLYRTDQYCYFVHWEHSYGATYGQVADYHFHTMDWKVLG